MTDEQQFPSVRVTSDDYLVAKSFAKSTIKRVVDMSKLDPKIAEYVFRDQNDVQSFKMKRPDIKELLDDKVFEKEGGSDSIGVLELYKYDTPMKGDLVVEYNDIGILCGTAGYLLIRDGYVYHHYIVRRS